MRHLLVALVLSMFMVVPALATINLNTATQAELESVKGIGPGKAKAIIAHREKNGAFKSVDELDKVKGFGKASVNKLRDQFEVKGSAAPK